MKNSAGYFNFPWKAGNVFSFRFQLEVGKCNNASAIVGLPMCAWYGAQPWEGKEEAWAGAAVQARGGRSGGAVAPPVHTHHKQNKRGKRGKKDTAAGD